MAMKFNYPDNYNPLVWHFEAFLYNIEITLKRNSTNESKTARIVTLCEEMNDEEIYNIGHRAKQEIQKELHTQNNGRDDLINDIKNTCNELKERSEHLFNTYLRKGDVKSRSFLNIMDTFFDFYEWFNKNVNKVSGSPKSNNSTGLIPLSQTPFQTQAQLDRFYHLHDTWNYKDKARWTYIFEVLTVQHKCKISQKIFFTFVSDHFQKVAKRKQESANDSELIETLKNIDSKLQ